MSAHHSTGAWGPPNSPSWSAKNQRPDPYQTLFRQLAAQRGSVQRRPDGGQGVIDCAFESTINISPVISEANIFHLPFFINSFENLDKMKAGQTGEAVFAAMEKVGLKPLDWGRTVFGK
jgi:hypothetical protein